MKEPYYKARSRWSYKWIGNALTSHCVESGMELIFQKKKTFNISHHVKAVFFKNALYLKKSPWEYGYLFLFATKFYKILKKLFEPGVVLLGSPSH